MEPIHSDAMDKAHSTGTSPPNITATEASRPFDTKSAPPPRTTAGITRSATGRIRQGLLSRAGSEVEDRSHKAESPAALTSDDEDSRISDSAPLPRRFPSSSSRVASFRSISSRQPSGQALAPNQRPIPQDLARVADAHSHVGETVASDGSSSLGRAKSISSGSSVNSTSSLEAAPFREAPLGNIRVGLHGGRGGPGTSTRDSRLAFTQVISSDGQQYRSSIPDVPQVAIGADQLGGFTSTASQTEQRPALDRHRGVPKVNNNAWMYRNAPGMRGSRLRNMHGADSGEAEAEAIETGQATPSKRSRDALRLKLAKSASRLGLKNSTASSFVDSSADSNLAVPMQVGQSSSSDEDAVPVMQAPRSPMGSRTPFFSTGPHSPHLYSTSSGPTSFSTTPTDLVSKTSMVTNAPMVVSKYAADLGRGHSKREDSAHFQEVLEGLTRLPAPKVSPRAESEGQAATNPFSQHMERASADLTRPLLRRADSSNNSRDRPASAGLAVLENAPERPHIYASNTARTTRRESSQTSNETPQGNDVRSSTVSPDSGKSRSRSRPASSSTGLTAAEVVRRDAQAGRASLPDSPSEPAPIGELTNPLSTPSIPVLPRTSSQSLKVESDVMQTSRSPETIRPQASHPLPNDPQAVARRKSQFSTSNNAASQAANRHNSSKLSTRGPNDFHFGDTLGEGSYSTVLEAWDLLSGPNPKKGGAIDPHATSAAAAMVGAGQKRGHRHIDLMGKKVYAVKVLDKVHILKQGKQKYVAVEKEALSRLIRHPGVVTLFWTFQDRESLYFVLELATNGELLTFIRKYGSFDQDSARFYAAMLAESIRAMHDVGVIHRDIKPENVLLDANMRIKVTDFGSAKLLSSGSSGADIQSPPASARGRAGSFVGTAEYVSPELLADSGQPASKASDWWAFGCVLFQMISGRPPFKGVNEYQTLQRVKNRDFVFPEGFPSDARDLIDRLLALNPSERLSASDVLSHVYFESIRFSDLWEQPVPPVRTGLNEPVQAPSRHSSRSAMSFDESFVSEQSPENSGEAQSSIHPAQTSGDDSRRRRSNDADDSDLSDGTSDGDSDGPVAVPNQVPQMPSAPQRRGSGLLRIVDGLTSKGAVPLDQPSPRSPSGSGLSILGARGGPVPQRRISTLSIETGSSSRRSREQAVDASSSRYSRESRSPLRTSSQLSPAPGNRGSPGLGIMSWSALLLPHELMLYSCPVLQKKTGTGKIFSKRRQLILTNFPRLLCVKETPEMLKVKSEVILALPVEARRDEVFTREQGRATPHFEDQPFPSVEEDDESHRKEGIDTNKLARPNLLTAVEHRGGKAFAVKTSTKTFIYEVFTGDAAPVVKGIRDASRCP